MMIDDGGFIFDLYIPVFCLGGFMTEREMMECIEGFVVWKKMVLGFL